MVLFSSQPVVVNARMQSQRVSRVGAINEPFLDGAKQHECSSPCQACQPHDACAIVFVRRRRIKSTCPLKTVTQDDRYGWAERHWHAGSRLSPTHARNGARVDVFMSRLAFILSTCALIMGGCSEESPPCLFGGDCPTNQVCQVGVCVLPGDGGRADSGEGDGGADAGGTDLGGADAGDRDSGGLDMGFVRCIATEACETSCSDMVDNDCNGQTDSDDLYCEGEMRCPPS